MACKQPFPEDFTDSDGYTDWEGYDVARTLWQDQGTHEAQPPFLGERWCGESPEPTVCPVSFDIDTVDLLRALMQA